MRSIKDAIKVNQSIEINDQSQLLKHGVITLMINGCKSTK